MAALSFDDTLIQHHFSNHFSGVIGEDCFFTHNYSGIGRILDGKADPRTTPYITTKIINIKRITCEIKRKLVEINLWYNYNHIQMNMIIWHTFRDGNYERFFITPTFDGEKRRIDYGNPDIYKIVPNVLNEFIDIANETAITEIKDMDR